MMAVNNCNQIFRVRNIIKNVYRSNSSIYVQGQEPEPKIREYFYYIDHQGMLFLDDARMKNFTSCFKEKKFLRFFFNQLRLNKTKRYEEFPFISICGKERNFVRCDDLPFVFSHVFEQNTENYLAYNNADNILNIKFEPEKIFMLPETGRVYHPAPERAGSVGLVKSKLAIEFSKYFTFDNGENNPPTHFTFKDVNYKLKNDWFLNLKK
ncbi:PREDICTED: UPF0598 protein CG30010 [Nicrophorus vespilloides]|uniref:UPF0598 protein CG30010 n=1 Tax=Nicrophorus vespilloides TaxID=110193 RepID=A0ABM1MQ58_NICVS|nr:PREDICTED: UPF0598 protein CG30010 [Nicrophorus vespilloides]